MNTPEPENVIQLGPVKKASIRPADRTPVPEPAKAPELILVPHPDGVLLRCSPQPGATNGRFVIHDAVGTVVAVTVNRDMAQLFCEATHVYFSAAKQNADEQVEAAKQVEQTLSAPVAPEGEPR